MPSQYTPNSDELGVKGQSRFGEICADAKLICNSSAERDRTGWDFYVQFPIEPLPAGMTFDKRRLPISCYVQVKTVWAHNDRIRLRLSSAERLAKERSPTFIYIFKVNEHLEFVDSYFIHMLDHNLSVVLKKLRQEQAKGTTAINTKAIGFLASQVGQRLPPSGIALRNAIAASVGENPDSYATRKADQLETLGFQTDRHTINVSLIGPSMEHFVDVFLGLKEAETAELKTHETRFGIKLPLHDNTEKHHPFKITPIPADQIRIIFRGKNFTNVAAFEGELFLPAIPDLPEDLMKCIIRCPLFEFQIQRGGVSFQTTKAPAELGKMKISVWKNLYLMQKILVEREGTVTFVRKDGRQFVLPIPEATINSAQAADYLLETLESAEKLLKMAGLSDLEVEILEVADVAPSILATYYIATQKEGPPALKIESPSRGGQLIPDGLKALFVNYLPLGGTRIAYYAVADLIPTRVSDSIEWTSTAIKLEELAAVPDEPSAYEKFLHQAKSRINLPYVVWRSSTDKLQILDQGFEAF